MRFQPKRYLKNVAREFAVFGKHGMPRGKPYIHEDKVIEKWLMRFGIEVGFYVDIAAGDGVTFSNTHFLMQKGWKGLAVEVDPEKFFRLSLSTLRYPGLNLCRCRVTPDNVVALLAANFVPKDFDLLSLDIDGYDHFVMSEILSSGFRPKLLCIEINESVPPPIFFTVKYIEDHFWVGDHFFGQSLQAAVQLCSTFGYNLAELHYNNAFFLRSDLLNNPVVTPGEAWLRGYVLQPDRNKLFAGNAELACIFEMTSSEQLRFLKKLFEKYEGRFILTL